MHLQPGQIISAAFLPTHAEVKKFEQRSGYSLLEVVLQDGNHTYKALRITDDQLAQIKHRSSDSPVTVAGNAEDFFFLIEANRIRLAYQFDPQLAVSVSQVDPASPPDRGGLPLRPQLAAHPFPDRR